MTAKTGFQGVTPIVLSSSCSVAARNSSVPDMGPLAYPFRKAVYIEEVRWILSVNDANAENLGALVSTRMTLGQNYLMRDPVPIWLLGTLMDISQEEWGDSTLNTPVSLSCYRWKFPQPLFVDAGQYITPVFSRGGDSLGSIGVQVAYVGRTVSPDQPRPGLISIPYAASFVTTAGNVYDQSNEFDLFNPFNRPLMAQRLTGRVLDTTTQQQVQSLTPATAGSSVTVLINDSWGGKMVNNNTGPSDVFDVPRAAWTVDTMMPPKGVYEARVWNIPTTQQVHIGLIGSREETP